MIPLSDEKLATRGLTAVTVAAAIAVTPVAFFTGWHSVRWLVAYNPTYEAFPFAWSTVLILAFVHLWVRIALEMKSAKLKQHATDMAFSIVHVVCLIVAIYPCSDSEMFRGSILGVVIALEAFFWLSLMRTIQWAYIGRTVNRSENAQ